MGVMIDLSGGCGSIDHDPHLFFRPGGVGLTGVGDDLVFVEKDGPLVDAAGWSVSEDVSRDFEDLGGSGDGAGVDLEVLGELLVGELDDALAEADGFSA